MTNKPKVLLIPTSRKDEAIVNLINCDLDLTRLYSSPRKFIISFKMES